MHLKKRNILSQLSTVFPVSTDTKPQMFVSVPVVKKVYRCIPKRCQDVKDFKELHPFTWRPDNWLSLLDSEACYPPMHLIWKPGGGCRVLLVQAFLSCWRCASWLWRSSTHSSIQPRKKTSDRASVSALFQKCRMLTALKLAKTS